MARKPRPSELAKKKSAGTKASAAPKPAAKKAAPKASQRHITGKSGDAPQAKVMKFPPTKVITDLLNTQLQKAADIQSITGEMGGAVKEAADKKHVDKKAFAITKGLEKLCRSNPQKFQVTYEHLLKYFQDADFQARADKQGQLELRTTPADSPEGDGDIEAGEEEPVAADAPAEPQTPIESEIPAGTDGEQSPRMRLVGAA